MDESATIIKPQFNAINGEELRYMILRELDEKLSAWDELRSHITYSKFMYLVDVQIAIDAYPNASTTKVGTMIQNQSKDYIPELGAEPKRSFFSFGTKSVITKPDQLRNEAGLPIPKTTSTPDGQIVDKLVDQTTPPINK